MGVFSKNDKKVKEITENYENLLNKYNELSDDYEKLQKSYDFIINENIILNKFANDIKEAMDNLCSFQ